MRTRYILLVPISPRVVRMTHEQTVAVMLRSRCLPVEAKDYSGAAIYYATAETLEDLAEFCEQNDLDGPCFEYTGVFDLKESE